LFSPNEYSGSFLWQYNFIKKFVFYFVATWGGNGKFSQEKLCHAFTPLALSNSLLSSVSANLNSGVAQGLYQKSGAGKDARYSLAKEFRLSKQLRQIRFVPSQTAIAIARARAHEHGRREA